MKNNEILEILEQRFINNSHRHQGVAWEDVLQKLDDKKIEALLWMETTQGEPDVFVLENNRLVFMDASKETPLARRSLCYDEQALEKRKKNKPQGSALGMINQKDLSLLDEKLYRTLQLFGEFDTKTSSWIETPPSIRELGGALFGDRRYSQVFVYHNGADSYYGVRGFRCILYID